MLVIHQSEMFIFFESQRKIHVCDFNVWRFYHNGTCNYIFIGFTHGDFCYIEYRIYTVIQLVSYTQDNMWNGHTYQCLFNSFDS